MADATDLLNMYKKAAVAAIEASKPANVIIGVVTSVSPITVKVSDKISVSKPLLVVPELLTDHVIDFSFQGEHQNLTMHNALKVNDKVAIIVNKGGQQFYILDRVEV